MIGTDIRKIELEHPEYVRSALRNYRWNFAALALDSSFFSFSVGMLSRDTIIPYFASHLTDSKLLIGLVPALYYLGLFMPQLIGAYLVSGRPTRKWSIFWIAVSERAGILAIALIAQFVGILGHSLALILLLVSYTVFTVTNGLIAPAYSDFISKTILRRRGLFYGVTNGVGNLIGFGAGLTASYLLDRYSFPTDLQLLFWLGFATSFISPFLIASFRETPFPTERKAETLRTFLAGIPEHVKETTGLSRYLIFRSILGLGVIGNAFFVLYALDRFGLKPGYVGVFTLVILFAQSALGLVWGWLGDHLGFKSVYVATSALVAGMGGLALWAPAAWAFTAIAACIGGVYAAFRTADPNTIFELAPPSETSRFIGIANTVVAPLMVLAALVGGWIVDAASYSWLFAGVVLIGLAAFGTSLFVLPDFRNGTQQQPILKDIGRL